MLKASQNESRLKCKTPNYTTTRIYRVFVYRVFESVGLGKDQTLWTLPRSSRKVKLDKRNDMKPKSFLTANQSYHQRIKEANYRLSQLFVSPSSHKGFVMKMHEELQ